MGEITIRQRHENQYRVSSQDDEGELYFGRVAQPSTSEA